MITGIVKWFDSAKGYGFIAADDGTDVFVHQSGILMNGYRYLDAEQRVSFDVEDTEKGSKAINVVVAE